MDGGQVRYEQVIDGSADVRRRMAEIRVSAESGDGLIRSTVDKYGELVDLALDPRIYRDRDPDALARAIIHTVDQAAQVARQQLFDLVKRFLPAGATLVDTDLYFDPFLSVLDRDNASGASAQSGTMTPVRTNSS